MDLFKQYKVSLSRMLNDILYLDNRSDFWSDQTLHQFYNLKTEIDFTEFREVSMEYLGRVAC